MTDLIKAGDLSNRYGVSTRTLRHYEEIGLIKSQRIADYAYRMYDDTNIKKLEQILILRKLNISLKDIQRIFNTTGSAIVLEVLGKKVVDIDEEVSLLHELKEIVIAFIRQIEQADFTQDADVKLLYSKAKEIESQLISTKYTGNPSPTHRLFDVTKKLEEKAASKLSIPDNIMKRLLQNVYFIWGSSKATANELGRRYGIPVYHTCNNRAKHEKNADPKFQPALCRIVPDYWALDPEDSAQWEIDIVRDFTPMVIMDLIQLTAKHEKVICESDIDIDSIIHYVTHAVTISDYSAASEFWDNQRDEIRSRDIAEEEKEKLMRNLNARAGEPKREIPYEAVRYGVKQVIQDDYSTVAQLADAVAAYFGLCHD